MSNILIGKWIDHFSHGDINAKIKMKRGKKSSQTILALNCDPLITAAPKPKWYLRRGFLTQSLHCVEIGNDYVDKSISDKYKYQLNFFIWLCIFVIVPSSQVLAKTDTLPTVQRFGLPSQSFNSFQYASPSEGIARIDIASPNRFGSVIANFPIQIPQGRQGIQPDISLDYNSENGNGWLGIGWSLGFSQITIDHRWGVPRYSASIESETYLLDGEQLSFLSHRQVSSPRSSEKEFTRRIEESFSRIIRHGTAPSNYWWEVIEKNGIRHFYGGSPETGWMANAVLTTSTGAIAQWAITQTIDLNGNHIIYEYQKRNVTSPSNLSGGSQLYPKTIYYTGFGAEKGKYKIAFATMNRTHEDNQINLRSGFKEVTDQVLKDIVVMYDDEKIRSYKPTYTKGNFGKTLLTSISEYDAMDSLFYTYNFDYHLSANPGFGAEKQWSPPADQLDGGFTSPNLIKEFNDLPTFLGSSKSSAYTVGGSLTFGPLGSPVTKENTVGGNYARTNMSGEGLLAFIDINGDGLPDKVFKKDGQIKYRPNLYGEVSNEAFGNVRPVWISTDGTNKRPLTKFSEFKGSTDAIGAEANPGFAFVGYTNETTKANTNIYFNDFNGDELIDLAYDGQVLFCHIDEMGDPVYTYRSSDSPSPLKGTGTIAGGGQTNSKEDFDLANPLHDVVKCWTAPYSGLISISGQVRLLEPANPSAQADGVKLSIQSGGSVLWSNTIAANDFTPKNATVANSLILKGQKIYFRVQSVDNGEQDMVKWSPEISYQGLDPLLTDPNLQTFHVFNAADDDLITSDQFEVIPVDGRITIEGRFSKQITSDDVEIRVLVRTPFDNPDLEPAISVAFTKSYAWNEVVDEELVIEDLALKANQTIQVKIYADSEIDPDQISFMPIYYVTSADDGSSVIDAEGNYLYSFCATPSHALYGEVWRKTEIFQSPVSGVLTLSPTINNTGLAGHLGALVVKKQNELLGKLTWTKLAGPQNVIFAEPLEINVGEGDSLYIEVFIHPLFPSDGFATNFNGSSVEVAVSFMMGNLPQLTLHSPGVYLQRNREDQIFGPQYRHWGQFVYKGSGARADAPIDQSLLKLPDIMVDEGEIDPDIDPDSLDIDVPELVFVTMKADIKSGRWQAIDDRTFIALDTMSSSRNGEDVFDDGSTGPVDNTRYSAPVIQTESIENAVSGGALVSGGTAWDQTKALRDVGDMNGDRYPDILTPAGIQYSTIQGGYEAQVTRHNLGDHETSSNALGAAVGGAFVSSGPSNSRTTKGAGSKKQNNRVKSGFTAQSDNSLSASDAAKASIGFSASYNHDEDETITTWLDINGDGLEDKLFEDGNVALNFGYSFGPRQSWGFEGIRGGVSDDIGAGVGISIVNGSIQGGTSFANTTNHSNFGFQDLNDDALLDLIVSSNPLVVRYNDGDSFGEPVTLVNSGQLDAGLSTGESINGGGTICINVPIFFFRFCISTSASTGNGVGRITTMLDDINGDGFVDFLASDAENDLRVRYSNQGKTNLLKTITTPFGGTTTFDYKISGNNYDLPFSKWTVQSVVTDDGFADDGIPARKMTVSYKNGKYDRHERDFFGFGEMMIDQWNGAELSRSIMVNYAVDRIYDAGHILSHAVLDSAGNVYKKTVYTYGLKDVVTGENLGVDFASSDDGKAFSALSSSKISYYDEAGVEALYLEKNYEYDPYGNVVKEVEIPNGNLEAALTSTYVYKADNEKVLRDAIEEVLVYSGTDLQRESKYETDGKGNILSINVSMDAENKALTTLKYDDYGNVIQAVRPANYTDESLILDFEYDETIHQYLTIEKDGYGFEKDYKYDVTRGKLTQFKGINDENFTYAYDVKGRLSEVLLPAHDLEGAPYSMKINYEHNGPNPFAEVVHYKAGNDNDLASITFENGQFDAFQQKYTAYLLDGAGFEEASVVSAGEIYDELGRLLEKYLPLRENPGLWTTPNYNADIYRPLRTSYDHLDRPLVMTERDGGVTNYSYDIAEDGRGITAFRTNITDALGNLTEEFYDIRGRLISTRRSEGSLYYEYDALSQLTAITYENGSDTRYAYDLGGRRVAIDHADGGLTELEYDNAGNLRNRISANIREVISKDGSIRYSYDKERLTEIDYPKNFQNKVQIHYGNAEDSLGQRGRIKLIEDGSGGISYVYDLNGNITRKVRTVIANRANQLTFLMEAGYDAWSRVRSQVYPDGEKITYSYDTGGRINGIKGEKDRREMVYLSDCGYDQYEDRIMTKMGNEVTTEDSYNVKGLLTQKRVKLAGKSLFEGDYEYYTNNLLKSGSSTYQTDLFAGKINNNFAYDVYQQLIDADGQLSADDEELMYTFMSEYNAQSITNLDLQLLQNGEEDKERSYIFDYAYGDTTHPGRPSEIGGRQLSYDFNGNLLLKNSRAIFEYQNNFWDEEDRLSGVSQNGKITRYTYDAFGRRIIRGISRFEGLFINGQPAAFLNHDDEFEADVFPEFTVTNNGFEKHYYLQGERMLTKRGTGKFNFAVLSLPEFAAGGINYKARLAAYEASINQFYKDNRIPPGPPTLPGFYLQPEVTTSTLPDATTDNPYTVVSGPWFKLLGIPDPSGPPGPPVRYPPKDSLLQPGFGFEPAVIIPETDVIYYHRDASDNVVMLSDFDGDVTHVFIYLPSGQIWKSYVSNQTLDNTQFYGSKYYDDRAKLYLDGTFTFDPKLMLRQSVEFSSRSFGQSTFQTRPESSLYQNITGISEDDDDVQDSEIINSSERPDLADGGVPDLSYVVEVNSDDIKSTYKKLRDKLQPRRVKNERRKFALAPGEDNKEFLDQLNGLIADYDETKTKRRKFQLKGDVKSTVLLTRLKVSLATDAFASKVKKSRKKSTGKIRVK
ncbi:MAG: hypothetical protein KDC49_08590 [Saprospiraceae bacterium]|nr:hypothetical protein [Saprospiraceae bacterium]